MIPHRSKSLDPRAKFPPRAPAAGSGGSAGSLFPPPAAPVGTGTSAQPAPRVRPHAYITPKQVQLLQIALKQTELNEWQYRTLLRNVAGCESSHHVKQREFEDIMAILEGCGFCDRFRGPIYWRERAEKRGLTATTRQVHKILAMAPASRYQLPALCQRFSHGRTTDVGLLTGQEAWELIEMLKAAELRELAKEPAPRASDIPTTFVPMTDEEIPF